MTEFNFDWGQQSWTEFLPTFWHWLMSLGETFLVGNVILATALAVLGYFAVQLGWRLYLVAYLKRRKARHTPGV